MSKDFHMFGIEKYDPNHPKMVWYKSLPKDKREEVFISEIQRISRAAQNNNAFPAAYHDSLKKYDKYINPQPVVKKENAIIKAFSDLITWIEKSLKNLPSLISRKIKIGKS